ncbi:MFS transporter [Bdellovibrionota bacterium FG-1]
MNSKTRRVIWLYYGFQFFFSMLLWVPIFYDYQKKIGLDDSQIFRIQSLYYIAFCVLEIPTGFLADFGGHRFCLKLGALVLTVANLLPIFAPTYFGFLGHFLLIALARSLVSGASSAYLYDYLKVHGAISEYKRAEGNARSYSLIGRVICWAGIGAIMQWHLSLPYWLTAGFAAVSVVFAFGLPVLKLPPSSESGQRTAAWRQLAPVLAVLVRTPVLLLIMFQGIAIFVMARIATVNLFQPVLSQKAFSLSAYGAIMSGLTVFEALGSAYPHWMRRWWNDLNSVFILTLAMALSLGALAYAGQVGTVVGFCAFSLAVGLAFPIQRQLLNDAIPDSRYRATLLSVESLIDRAVCAGVVGLMGTYVAGGRVGDFLKVSAAVSLLNVAILYLAVVWVLRRRRNSTPSVIV